jgi:type II secretory pathway component PulF
VVGDVVVNIGIAWVLLGGLGLAAWWAVKTAGASVAMDGFLNAIPMVGGVRRHWALARFCQVFQTGLLAAFQITETLRLAGDASQSAQLREAARRAAKSVDKGGRLDDSMKKTGVFPKAFMQSVATAEETGTLDREMERWAVAEAELAARSQDRLAEWMPRILYVLIMIYIVARIFGMVAGIYAPVLKMLDDG